MMSPDLQRILRIRDYCLEIQKTISRYGNDFQIFDSDGDYQRSIAFFYPTDWRAWRFPF